MLSCSVFSYLPGVNRTFVHDSPERVTQQMSNFPYIMTIKFLLKCIYLINSADQFWWKKNVVWKPKVLDHSDFQHGSLCDPTYQKIVMINPGIACIYWEPPVSGTVLSALQQVSFVIFDCTECSPMTLSLCFHRRGTTFVLAGSILLYLMRPMSLGCTIFFHHFMSSHPLCTHR